MRSLLLITACTTISFSQETPSSVPPDPQTILMNQFRFTDESGTERTLNGRVLVQAQDGGILVEDQEGAYWNITPDQMNEQTPTGSEFKRLSREEHLALLKARYETHSDIRATDHYLIVSNAGPGYTDWTAALLERYHETFFKFWNEAGIELQQPQDVLVVIIWRDKSTFDEFYVADVGQKTVQSFGYYSNRRNHVVLYDFANKPTTTAEQREKQTVRQIERLARKNPFNVATVVHEATHQLAFNTGLQTRYADNPVWFTEGIAMYCESADTGVASRTPRIGRLNALRKKKVKPLLQQISAETITDLTHSDKRFQNAETAENAYTEAWALTSYLMNRKRDEFIEFIKSNRKNPRLIWRDEDERRKNFEATLGSPKALERPMKSYLR